MDLQNLRGTKTEVKILLRFDRNSSFLTAQDKAGLLKNWGSGAFIVAQLFIPQGYQTVAGG